MTIEIPHRCGARVRVQLVDVLRNPVCPRCKKPVTVSWWQRMRARMAGAKLPSNSVSHGRRSASKPWGEPDAGKEFAESLAILAQRGWRTGNNAQNFLYQPSLLLIRDDDVLSEALGSLYEHARCWVPGFDVPFHVPASSVSGNLDSAGRFNIDGDGLTSIRVASQFLNVPKAAWLILAHEVCHHILYQSGLADRTDTSRNERLTDAAMFICGFGDLAWRGQTFIDRVESRYRETHLGYLTPGEYSFAYHWVIAARRTNQMSGIASVKPKYPHLASGFRMETSCDSAFKGLKTRIPDAATRGRLIRHYKAVHPGETDEEIARRILEINACSVSLD